MTVIHPIYKTVLKSTLALLVGTLLLQFKIMFLVPILLIIASLTILIAQTYLYLSGQKDRDVFEFYAQAVGSKDSSQDSPADK
ncbi:hypothetical protein [Vibrio superstes]|uniref:Uncharacterized protein n=1 Tax=Vibrio superstes NBRC 103154 TaxID=1219062 RepID=A0A511QR54_9VIBR|nr:hypothetical protein [Vibrio superstes]GEM79062.1 hypothetical protein VSU01S_13070 [Vibrio superstes NBRC 103154]